MTYEEVLALTQANSKAIDKLTASIAELSANARAEQARRAEENARRDKEFAESKARWDAENARRDKELAESNARRDAENAQRDKEFAESKARWDAESAQRDKEFAESKARWDNFMERYGGYVDNDSRKIENFFIEGLEQLDLAVGAIKFDEIIPNAQRRKKKVVIIELDALLINDTTVGILEVKSTLHVNDVEKVRDKLIRRFRDYYPEYRDKQLAVLMAGELINPDAAELARELGYIVVKPNNQGVNVDASCYQAA